MISGASISTVRPLYPSIAISGTDLYHRIEGHGAGHLSAGDVDVRWGDDIDLVFAYRVGVVAGKAVLEGVAAGVLGSEPRLEHLPGCLARSESGQTHLLGQAGEGRIEVLLELRFADLDRDFDLVALEGFDRRFH